MSFLSRAHSSDTLVRGLNLARAPDLSIDSDPDPAALAAELDRLEDPQLTMGFTSKKQQSIWKELFLVEFENATNLLSQAYSSYCPGDQAGLDCSGPHDLYGRCRGLWQNDRGWFDDPFRSRGGITKKKQHQVNPWFQYFYPLYLWPEKLNKTHEILNPDSMGLYWNVFNTYILRRS